MAQQLTAKQQIALDKELDFCDHDWKYIASMGRWYRCYKCGCLTDTWEKDENGFSLIIRCEAPSCMNRAVCVTRQKDEYGDCGNRCREHISTFCNDFLLHFMRVRK